MDFVQVIFIAVFVGVLIIVLGIQYFKSKENMALIEKNIHPRTNPKRGIYLIWGIVLIGIASGILVGIIIDKYFLAKTNPLIYIISILFFSGLSFIAAHYVSKDN